MAHHASASTTPRKREKSEHLPNRFRPGTAERSMARPLALLAAVLAASSDCLASAAAEGSTTLYVSTTGSASASGSKDAPFATCAQAVAKLTAMASPGGA
eukprot:COSAG06_NODE_43586_length_370_cov_1.605166_1_plen_99_part_10